MKNTDQLKSDLSKIEADSSELEEKVKTVDDNLIYVHDKLAIPETLHERLSTLDSNLKMASELLGIMRIVPPISAAASNTKKVIDLFREPVSKAKKVSGDIDQRLKPVRTKVHQIRQEVAKLDGELNSVIQKEQALIQAVNHAQVCIISLPSGAVKTESSSTLEALSGQAEPPAAKVQSAQHAVLETVNRAENQINAVKKNVQALLEIDAAIARVMDVLHPLISQLQAIKKVFKHIIRVPYGGYPKLCAKRVWPGVKVYYPCGWYTTYFSFSIQQILNGISGLVKPVMDLLDKAMNAVLDPLLKALNLNIKLPEIPGLDKLKDIVDSLTAVFDPMSQAFDRLLGEAQALRARLQSLFELTQPYHKIYQACVQGRGEPSDATGLVLEQPQVEADPAVFDAMVTFNERTYLLQGDTYWLFLPGQEEAEGPFAIADEFGRDDHGQPMAGPFDAACVVGDRMGLFRGKSFYLCLPGENAACQGPLAIESHWGQNAQGQWLTGPFDAAVSHRGRTYLFQGDQYYVSNAGEDTRAQGPQPIKGDWGSNNEKNPLDGPFDAVTLYADRLYIRKGDSYWDQPLSVIKALTR